ncbi:proline reductase-associated electron transfer protein PrdC [Lutispora thermophila DSM 19022]|uniref:Proline reductase-associated electron transfer protein PrdC n=2 Tax=Lutispora TaxID=667112 RepID=A0A1M6GU72_9FIRM|nr:proline reductase-associated electron transfer protein PrdC [Lutispora thermophila DSM 19022]
MERVELMLRQHVGAPCSPIVKVGDEVKRGQLVAVPTGLGANIHTSVSGIVKDITDISIVIDAFDEQSPDYIPIKETDDYLEAIKEAGIVGAGGAGFPAHVKFKTDLKGGCFIANAAECEPLLAHNIAYLEQNPDVIIRGMKYLMEITNAKVGYIAIKVKHLNAIKAINKALKPEDNISIKILPDMYPAGDERVIVREFTGVELKPGELPSAANAVISNVETIKNVTLAIEQRKPVIDKDLTVAGRVRGAKEGKVFFNVPIGYPVKKYIEKAGGYLEPHGEIILGGPFTGKHGEETSPIVKTLGGIIVAMPFPQEKRKVGILACECGAQEERLREIAAGMGAQVVAERKCKRMVEVNGRWRCEKPGVCPGQASTVLDLKREGAEVILTGTCGD